MAIFKRKIQQSSNDSVTVNDPLSGMQYASNQTATEGTTNKYTSYESQIKAIYNKYNALDQRGNQLVRSIVDIRAAFLVGGNISISTDDEVLRSWIDLFLISNKLKGSAFIDAVKTAEMSGECLFVLQYDAKAFENMPIKIKRFISRDIEIVVDAEEDFFTADIKGIALKNEEQLIKYYPDELSVYLKIGGDFKENARPVTKIATILTDIENYDRALKDIRHNNHIYARVTPTFKVTNDNEARKLKTWLQQIQWKIGTAFIGNAEFDYKSPASSAYENLKTELDATLKTISAVTGIPVHWLGYADMMSNRATADSLYEVIKNATVYERLKWQEAIKELISKAMQLFINKGGKLKYSTDFEVNLPLTSYDGLLQKVQALSIAYSDKAISIDDYRQEIPNIDPLVTKKAIDNQDEQDKQSFDARIESVKTEELNEYEERNEDEEDEENGEDK